MRIVGDGEACGRFESTCETLASLGHGEGRSAVPAEVAAMNAHAAGCAECTGAIRAAEALRRTREAFDVPEPAESYWADFSERLDARLQGEASAPAAPAGKRTWAPRAVLAAAAAVLLVVGALAVRNARTTVLEIPAEAELLERLDRAPGTRVAEYLDEIAPPELGAATEDLAEAGDLLRENGAAGADDEGPYDLFFDLGDEDRDQLIKEMSGEIG